MEILTRSKLCHFVGRYVLRAKLFCLKSFVPVTGLECSHGKIFIPVTEISVNGPARPLIWTHRYFNKEKSGEARSRKPSQPGWPGSYEEALSLLLDLVAVDRCRIEFVEGRKKVNFVPLRKLLTARRDQRMLTIRKKYLYTLLKRNQIDLTQLTRIVNPS